MAGRHVSYQQSEQNANVLLTTSLRFSPLASKTAPAVAEFPATVSVKNLQQNVLCEIPIEFLGTKDYYSTKFVHTNLLERLITPPDCPLLEFDQRNAPWRSRNGVQEVTTTRMDEHFRGDRLLTTSKVFCNTWFIETYLHHFLHKNVAIFSQLSFTVRAIR